MYVNLKLKQQPNFVAFKAFIATSMQGHSILYTFAKKKRIIKKTSYPLAEMEIRYLIQIVVGLFFTLVHFIIHMYGTSYK